MAAGSHKSHIERRPSDPAALLLVVAATPKTIDELRIALDTVRYSLVEAPSLDEGLWYLRVNPYSVVVLDTSQLCRDGLNIVTITQKIRAVSSAPLLFTRPHDLKLEQLEEALSLGGVDCLELPFSPHEVRGKIRGLVAMSSMSRDGEHWFRHMIEAFQDYAICLLDPDGKVITWNSGAERIKQYEAGEIIGKHFSVFYPPGLVESGWPAHELKIATEEGRFDDEGWRLRKDGSAFWANVIITAIKDETGHLQGFATVTRDLTSRKESDESGRRLAEEKVARQIVSQILEREETQKRLEEQTANAETLLRIGMLLSRQLKLQPLVQIVTDECTSLCGAQFGAFFYNELKDSGESYSLYTVSGVPRECFEQFPMPRNTLLFAPTFRGEGVVRLDDVSKDPRYGKSAPYHGMPEGHLPVRSYLAVPVVSREGEVLGGLFLGHAEAGMFTMQHERLLTAIAAQAASAIDNARLHQQTQAVADRLSIALEAADLGDWRWDTTSDMVVFSERAAELFGIPPGPHMTWRKMQELLHAEDKTRVAKEIKRVIEERIPYNIEYRVLRQDGELVWIEALGSAVYDELNNVTGMYGVVKDITERKRLEESLKASEARIQGLMEQAPFSVQILSPDGRTLRVNRAWEELWGLTLEQVRDYNVLEDPQLEAKGVVKYLRKAFEGEATFIPPIAYDPTETLPGRTRHSESVRWVGAVAYPLKDEAGTIQEVVIVHDDLTARRKAEAALRDSEERLRLALDAGGMGVWDWNIRTGELKWSDSLEPLHGLDPGTFGGTFEHFRELIHPDDRDQVLAAISRAVETRGDFYVEFRNLRKNGSISWIAGTGKVFVGEDGKALRMIGVGLDVTQRKRAEHTARFLADASAELSVLVDFEDTLQKVASFAVPHFADWATVDVLEDNGTLRRVAVSHVNPDKVQSAIEIHRRFPPDPEVRSGVWEVLRTGQAELVPVITDQMLTASIKDEELLSIIRDLGLKSYIGVPLTVRGKAIGVLTFIIAESDYVYDETDLTVAKDLAGRAGIAVENTNLYRELKDADQRKDEFLATLAHELRNPLAPIRNGLQVMRLAGSESKMAVEAREMMERQLAHMVRLVDDLLDVSRITRNKLELRKERLELAAVIHAAIETSRPLIEKFHHAFAQFLPEKPVFIEGDPVRLAQIFSNLLNNAAKYTPEGGSIRLTAEVTGLEVEIRIKDNGIGIPSVSLPTVFEMFSQLDRSVEQTYGGLGIGLTLVKRLTEMHGGTVSADSEGQGRGSEFSVRLPIAHEPRAASSESCQPDQTASRHHRRRILIVDDNQDAAKTLAMVLQLMDNEMQIALDGYSAIAMAEEYRPDVILLDIGLPNLSGHEVCRRIRESEWGAGVLIVALTGWGQEEDRRLSREAGFNHHLVKPVDVSALAELISLK